MSSLARQCRAMDLCQSGLSETAEEHGSCHVLEGQVSNHLIVNMEGSSVLT